MVADTRSSVPQFSVARDLDAVYIYATAARRRETSIAAKRSAAAVFADGIKRLKTLIGTSATDGRCRSGPDELRRPPRPLHHNPRSLSSRCPCFFQNFFFFFFLAWFTAASRGYWEPIFRRLPLAVKAYAKSGKINLRLPAGIGYCPASLPRRRTTQGPV